MSGALVHDNYVEAILKGRTFRAIPDWVLLTLEVLFGIGAAVLFAAYSQLWVKVAAFFGLLALLIVVQWLMLGLFGTIFEAIVPLVGLAVHSIIDRLIEEKAHPGKPD
jgi:asparagine N-glycosylation enzyme membrane subunit Stt3